VRSPRGAESLESGVRHWKEAEVAALASASAHRGREEKRRHLYFRPGRETSALITDFAAREQVTVYAVLLPLTLCCSLICPRE